MALIPEWLRPPTFANESETRKARQLYVILLIVIGLLTILDFHFITNVTGFYDPLSLTLTFLILLSIGLLLLIQRGFVRSAGYIFTSASWLGLTYIAWGADGIRDSTFIAYLVIILVASLLLGWRMALTFTALSIGAGWAFAIAQNNGLIAPSLDTVTNYARDISFIFALSGVLIYLTINNLQQALHKAQESNQQLESLSAKLEQRVDERTKALRASTEVSRRLSTLLNQDQLLSEVVNQVQDTFDYYHVHIYLLEEKSGDLIMRGGTGEAGIALLASDHRLAAGRGLVGRAAKTNDVVLVNDVSQEPTWLPNPLLPDTQSEIAVPIAIGDQPLGVLDVQHDKAGALGEEDAFLLQSVANQVAVALRNARLFEQAQEQAKREAIINQIGQQIQNTADIEGALKVAIRELGEALQMERATIQVSTPKGRNGRSHSTETMPSTMS